MQYHLIYNLIKSYLAYLYKVVLLLFVMFTFVILKM